MFALICLVAFWLVMAWVLEKGIGKVHQNMGLDNPFISIKARMRRGTSLPEAVIESGIDRFAFGWKFFLYLCRKVLPFGKESNEWSFGKFFEQEASREAEAQKMVDDYGGNLSDYL